uniref:Protein kinase domain-containing protein n=1 Tax=Meloidogyne hapla TaxID=6305 RepID=A0A1I8AWP5_MELHA
MVFEYMERRSLMELPTQNPLKEQLAWKYFRDTLKGLEYQSDSVKIADFGVSCEFEGIDAFLTGTAGTPAFMAPEALSENSNQFYSGRAQDIWSLGITLYALVFGSVPWYDPYVIALYKKIKNDPVTLPENIPISELLKGLILGMLCKDPGLRYDIMQGKVLMPTEEENCSLVTVTQEEVNQAVRIIPHLGTLILVKAMGRKKHFGNPFREPVIDHDSLLEHPGRRHRRKSSLPEGGSTASPVRSHSREHLNNQQQQINLEEPSTTNSELNPLIIINKMDRLNIEEGNEENNKEMPQLLNGSLNFKD